MSNKPPRCQDKCPIPTGNFRKNCKGPAPTTQFLSEIAMNTKRVILRDGVSVVAGVDINGEVVTPLTPCSPMGELGEYSCRNAGVKQAVELAVADTETLDNILQAD